LIDASKILKERGVNHLVYIIGPGSMYSELMEYINKLGLSLNVKILGDGAGLPFSETVKYVKNATVGVFPGIRTDWGDEDGIPNAILEYAALRIPIVSTDAGSSQDFVEDNETGLLVPQKNPSMLADKIEKLIFDKELSQRLVASAFVKVNEIFDISKNVVSLEKLLI